MSVISARILGKSTVALTDQALLSGLNLAIGLAFVALAAKEEFGLYSLLLSVVALTQAVQGALVTSPMMTLFPKLDAHQQRQSGIDVFLGQVVAGVGTALVIGVGWWVVDSSGPGFSTLLTAFALACGIVGVCARELTRNLFLTRQDQAGALAVDFVFASLVCVFLVPMILGGRLEASLVLLSTSAACLLATVYGMTKGGSGWPVASWHGLAQLTREFWVCGRWALPSVFVSWTYLNGINFLLVWMHSAREVADFNAARLLLMPTGFLLLAWVAVFRPRSSELIGQGHVGHVLSQARKSLVVLTLVVLLYSMVIVASLPVLASTLFSAEYRDLKGQTLAWAAYFLAVCARSVWMICLLGTQQGYKDSLRYNVVSVVVCGPVALVLTKDYGALGAVIGLTAIETLQALLYWLYGIRRLNANAAMVARGPGAS